MSNINKHGLSRHIPEVVKHQLRKEAGFGCVLCGNAIFEYEHIDPEWSDAKKHNPEAMTILCGNCHNNVTKGFISKKKVQLAKTTPQCKKIGSSHLKLELTNHPMIVELGGIQFIDTPTIINFDGKNILKIEKPEEEYSPPQITAKFYDRNGKLVARINRNCWNGISNTFDIKTIGNKIIIRSAKNKVDLIMKIQHPNKIVIEKIDMKYSDYKITGDLINKFKIITPKAELHLPHEIIKKIQCSTSGITIMNNDIQFGTDIPLLAKCINYQPLSPNLNIHDCKIEFFLAKDHPDSPPDIDDNAIIFRISDHQGHWVEFADVQIEKIN